jgi:hypothetical protein
MMNDQKLNIVYGDEQQLEEQRLFPEYFHRPAAH